MNINPALLHTIVRNPIQEPVNPALLHTIVREPKATPVEEPTFEGKTAAEWEQEALESNRRAQESWERSDTDGFLSQAASDAMARLYRLNARIAADGGTAEFPAVFDLKGNLIQIHTSEGQYGDYYFNVNNAVNGAPRYIRPSQAKNGARRLATDEKKGFRVGTIRAVPLTTLVGKYTWSAAIRLNSNTHMEDVTVVDNGTKGTQYADWK
jgi:hypothetical protein